MNVGEPFNGIIAAIAPRSEPAYVRTARLLREKAKQYDVSAKEGLDAGMNYPPFHIGHADGLRDAADIVEREGRAG